jgi:hypothetical protein
MATKKKTKKLTKVRRTAGKKKKSSSKKTAPAKKLGKSPASKKKAATRKAGKTVRAKKAATAKRKPQQGLLGDEMTFPQQIARSDAAGQSGDLQGLSNLESSDSESVDELLEEGNAFEAEAVAGVEDSGDLGEREVRTHEVPEDDVPSEYLDKD